MKNYQKPNKKRNKAIINLRNINHWSFRKIGNKMNITGERARQIYLKSKS